MRTIVLAYKDFPSPPDWDEEISLEASERLTGLVAKTYKAETDLTFLGVMGIIDPIREGVPRAIKQCNLAGVDVRMITGDNLQTAIAIADNAGILKEHHFHHVLSSPTDGNLRTAEGKPWTALNCTIEVVGEEKGSKPQKKQVELPLSLI